MTAPSDASDDVLAEAIARDDQAMLTVLATTNESARIRRLAAARLRDQATLNAIVANDPNSFVKESAVRRITSQDDLSRLVWQCADRIARWTATECLSDAPKLREIVLRHPEPEVRSRAEIRLRALHGPAAGPTQRDLLAVARRDPDPAVRRAALERLADRSLTKLARDERTPRALRIAAVERLWDRTALATIARDTDADVRRAAAAQMKRATERAAQRETSPGKLSTSFGVRFDQRAPKPRHGEPLGKRRLEADDPAASTRGRPSAARERRGSDAPVWRHPPGGGFNATIDVKPRNTVATRTTTPKQVAELIRTTAEDSSTRHVLPPEIARSRSSQDVLAAPGDQVMCSAYAPPTLQRGKTMMVQAFLHLPARAAEAEAQARDFDDEARRRGFRSLAAPIPRGTEVVLVLEAPALTVMEPVQHMVWNGITESVQFEVAAPATASAGTTLARLTMSVGSVPLGHLSFKVELTDTAIDATPQALGDAAVLYRLAFISYASSDRAEVLKRVQMLSLLDVEFFQDMLHLDPGERWERKLYEKIDQCDLFLLFWSTAAKQSEWVLREARRAIARRGPAEESPPRILPVLLEGPPPVPPPDELKQLHFNDPMLYFLAGSAERAAPPA